MKLLLLIIIIIIFIIYINSIENFKVLLKVKPNINNPNIQLNYSDKLKKESTIVPTNLSDLYALFTKNITKFEMKVNLTKKQFTDNFLDSAEGISFKAWMAISIFLDNSSYSIFFVNKPFPPMSDILLF